MTALSSPDQSVTVTPVGKDEFMTIRSKTAIVTGASSGMISRYVIDSRSKKEIHDIRRLAMMGAASAVNCFKPSSVESSATMNDIPVGSEPKYTRTCSVPPTP